MVDGLGIIGVPSDYGAAGLGPRTFRVGSVDSFGGSFDWDFFLVKCLNLLDIEIIDDWSLKPVSYSVERKN